MNDRPNILKEAITRHHDEGYWRETIEKAKANPFTERYCEGVVKEGITSDIAGALGRMHGVVVEAAKPELIGRELVDVINVKDALVRFPRAKLAKAYKVGEGSEYWMTGERYDTVDVKADIEIKAGCKYTKNFFEDASWPVLERQTAEIGRAIGELETKTIYDYLVAQAGTTAAGDGDGTLQWTEVVKIWNELKKIDWNPAVIALHPDEIADLWVDDKFIHTFYFGNEIDVARGLLGRSYLGMNIVVSSKCTAATVIVNDKASTAFIVRRDIITEPFEDPSKDLYGVVASERIGLGVLRSTAIGKLTSI